MNTLYFGIIISFCIPCVKHSLKPSYLRQEIMLPVYTRKYGQDLCIDGHDLYKIEVQTGRINLVIKFLDTCKRMQTWTKKYKHVIWECYFHAIWENK